MDQGTYFQESLPAPQLDGEIWKLILDRSQIPENIIHTLKGEVWVTEKGIDERGEEVARGGWKVVGEPLMNDHGIRFFSTYLYSAMSPDKLATFLTEEEVNRMARDMTKAIILIIVERGDEFGIAPANRSFIVELLDHYYFSNLTASRKGTILNALKPMYHREEHTTVAPAQQGLRLPNLLGGR